MLDRFPSNILTPNLGHPLNRGRVAWWLVTPRTSGGGKLVDLMGRNHGTLTGMTSTGGWRGTTRPGGFGHLLFDGTDDRVVIANTTSMFNFTSGGFTLAAWIRTTAGNGVLLSCLNGSVAGWEWAVGVGVTGGKQGLWNGSAWSSASTTLVNTGSWVHVAMVHSSGGPTAFYVNGIADGSFAHADPSTRTVDLQIGARPGSSQWFNGSIDGVSAWGRPLSAAEVAEDYRLSRLGYPGVLNRAGAWAFGGGASIIPQAMSYYRRRRTG